jgi:phage tail sheath protein FI
MLLIITVMPEIAKALKWYLFEFNDSDTRGLIKTMVDDYMNTVKTNKGVYDFQTSVHASDDDIDNGRLYVDLIIKPTLAINEIHFRMVPIKTGASFSTTLEILEG